MGYGDYDFNIVSWSLCIQYNLVSWSNVKHSLCKQEEILLSNWLNLCAKEMTYRIYEDCTCWAKNKNCYEVDLRSWHPGMDVSWYRFGKLRISKGNPT